MSRRRTQTNFLSHEILAEHCTQLVKVPYSSPERNRVFDEGGSTPSILSRYMIRTRMKYKSFCITVALILFQQVRKLFKEENKPYDIFQLKLHLL